jgi:hypothetical protein
MEDHLAAGDRFNDMFGAPHVTDDRLRAEVSHLSHARHPANETDDGVVTPYERRDERSTERACRSGYEYTHGRHTNGLAIQPVCGRSRITL